MNLYYCFDRFIFMLYVRTNRGKDNRSKLTMSHAAGSKSYARVGHELVKKNYNH